MTREQVREAVCRAITLTLERSGRAAPTFLDSDRPIDAYEGFDSQCGVEVTLELEQILRLEDLGTNVFVNGSGKTARARTLKQVVDHVHAIMKVKGDQ